MGRLRLLIISALTGATSAAHAQGEAIEPDRGLASGGYVDEIEIAVPPAPGPIPKVSLVTSHTTADGPLGAGWQLLATSAITRHSAGGGVPGYSVDDQYRVDGTRLVEVSAYGSAHHQAETYDGARYDYDIEENTWTKRQNGWTWTFGGLENNATQLLYSLWGRSQHAGTFVAGFELPVGQFCPNSNVRCNTVAWHLSRAEDPYGNVIDYEYELPELPDSLPDDDDRFWFESIRAPRLTRITYQGAQVLFQWADRPDPRIDVSSGTPTFLTARIIGISTTRGFEVYSRTAVRYQDELESGCDGQPAVVSAGVSRIREIVAIGGETERRLRCIETHREASDWGESHDATYLGDAIAPRLQDPTVESSIPVAIQLDNDAVTDLVVLHLDSNNNPEVYAYVATRDPAQPFESSATSSTAADWEVELNSILTHDLFANERGYRFVDLDGDRRVEVVYENDVGEVWALERRRRGGFERRMTSIDRCHLRHGAFTDINGDGLSDLVVRANGGDADCAGILEPIWILNLEGDVDSGGSAVFPLELPYSPTNLPPSWQVKRDLACGGSISWPETYDPDMTEPSQYFGQMMSLGDANGDGLADLRIGLYLCWTHDEVSDLWLPVDDSWVSALHFGDGYGAFIGSGLRGDAPMLLSTTNFPIAIPAISEKRLLPGFSGLIDLDRSGRLALLGPSPTGDGYGIVAGRYQGILAGFDVGSVNPLGGWAGGGGGGSVTVLSGYANSAWGCNMNAVTPAFGDFNGDGFTDVLTLENHEFSPPNPDCDAGRLCPLLRLNRRTQGEGRIVSVHNSWGGTTQLTWSASALGDNPESPINVEVVTEVDGSAGTVKYAYSGASVDADGTPTAFAQVERQNARGGVDVFGYSTSRLIGPRLLYAARHRKDDQSIEKVESYVYGHRDQASGALSINTDEPLFNPLVRRCDFVVDHADSGGNQSVTVNDLVTNCWGHGGADVGGETVQVIVGHDHRPSYPASAALYNSLWETGTMTGSIGLGDHGLEPSSWTGATEFSGYRLVWFRWPLPSDVPDPGIEAIGNNLAVPDGTAPTVVRTFVTEWSYDPANNLVGVVDAFGDISDPADDYSTQFEWNTPDPSGPWGQLLQKQVFVNGELYAHETHSVFSGWDDPGVITSCGDADGDGSFNCIAYGRSYYPNGQLETETTPDGETSYEYDSCGLVKVKTDVANRVETTERDGLCRAESSTIEDISYTRVFDAFHRVTQETLATAGGPPMTVELIRDDQIDIPVDSNFNEPRHAELRSDGRLILTYLDEFGRETRRIQCADAGGMGGVQGVLGTASCAPDTERILSTTAYGTDGVAKVSVGSFEVGETPRVSAVAHDGHGRAVVRLAPDPGSANAGWVRTDIGYRPDRIDRFGPSGRLVTTVRGPGYETLEVGGVFRGETQVNAVGVPISHTSSDGGVTKLALDDFGQTRRLYRNESVECISASGASSTCTLDVSFERDWAGRVIREIRSDGRVFETDYDVLGRVTERRDQGVVVETRNYTFGGPGLAATIVTTDEAGVATTVTADGLGRPLSREVLGETISYEYGDSGVVTSMTDAAGLVSSFEYDGRGELVAVVTAGGGRTEIQTNGAGQVIETVDADGVVETSEYTYGGLVRRVSRGPWVVRDLAYDQFGRLIGVDVAGARSETDYDAFDRPVERRDGVDVAAGTAEKTTRWTYDDGDRVVRRDINPVANQTRPTLYTYNAYGWLTEVRRPLSTITSIGHDAAGRVRAVTDPGGFVSTTDYDLRGRPVTIATRDRGTLSFAYEAGVTYGGLGGLRRITTQDQTDTENGVSTTEYIDGRGRTVAATLTDGTAVHHTYVDGRLEVTEYLDAAGDVIRQTDRSYGPRGRLSSVVGPYYPGDALSSRAKTAWIYTDAGRTRLQSTPRGAVGDDDDRTVFGYENGLLATETYLGLTRTLHRDIVGSPRVTSETLEGDGQLRESVFTYDDAGRVTAVDISADGKTWRRERDGLDYYDRPAVERGLSNGTLSVRHTWFYNALGRPLMRTTFMPNHGNRVARWSWGPSGELASLTTPSGLEFEYLYDSALPGRLGEIREAGTANIFWQVTARNLRGDPTDISLPMAGDSTAIAYDLRGRPNRRASGLQTADLTYDHQGRILTEIIGTPSDAYQNEYVYDGAGRLVTEIRGKSGEQIDYLLDRAGNRTQMKRSVGGSIVDQRTYEYSGAVLVGMNGQAIDRDAWLGVTIDQRGTEYHRLPDGSVETMTAASGSQVSFVRGPNGLAWRAEEGGTSPRFTTWGLDAASAPMEVEEAGGLVRTYVRAGREVVGVLEGGVYAPLDEGPRGTVARFGGELLDGPTSFGENISAPSTSDERFLYAGLESLPIEMGPVMSARQRFYDPETGQFLRPDPVGLAGGPNRLWYADADPVNKRDPLGLTACSSGAGQVKLPHDILKARTFDFVTFEQPETVFQGQIGGFGAGINPDVFKIDVTGTGGFPGAPGPSCWSCPSPGGGEEGDVTDTDSLAFGGSALFGRKKGGSSEGGDGSSSKKRKGKKGKKGKTTRTYVLSGPVDDLGMESTGGSMPVEGREPEPWEDPGDPTEDELEAAEEEPKPPGQDLSPEQEQAIEDFLMAPETGPSYPRDRPNEGPHSPNDPAVEHPGIPGINPFIRRVTEWRNDFESVTAGKETDEMVIALTFDDGPNPEHAEKILDALNSANAKATFFIHGEKFDLIENDNARDKDDDYTKSDISEIAGLAAVMRMDAEGHELAGHGHSAEHLHLSKMSTSEALDSASQTRDLIRFETGQDSNWIRPPEGELTTGHAAAFDSNGWNVAFWDVDSLDWHRPTQRSSGSAGVTRRVLKQAHPGAVVLLHENQYTAKALPDILAGLKDAGYRLVTISELFAPLARGGFELEDLR